MAHNERLIRDICGMVEDIASTVRKENPKAERMMFGYSIYMGNRHEKNTHIILDVYNICFNGFFSARKRLLSIRIATIAFVLRTFCWT